MSDLLTRDEYKAIAAGQRLDQRQIHAAEVRQDDGFAEPGDGRSTGSHRERFLLRIAGVFVHVERHDRVDLSDAAIDDRIDA